jgi:hypothetical protein
MDWLNVGDFLIGLIIGLIVGLIPTGRAALKDHLRRRRFKPLFGNPGTACIVVPVHRDETTDRYPSVYRMVKAETMMAALRLQGHLQQLGWEVAIRPTEDSDKALLKRCAKSTMFFLGSTRIRTPVTRLFKELKSDFSFENRELIVEDEKSGEQKSKILPTIVDKTGAGEWSSPMDKVVHANADVGLVIKANNEECPGRSVFWLAGIHAIGTWGATEFLCSDEGLREILSRVGSRNFSAVVRTEYTRLEDQAHREPSRFLNVTKYELELPPRDFPRRRGGSH